MTQSTPRYRHSDYEERCIECTEPADTTCTRCGGALCASHAHAAKKRCERCEADFELHTTEREPFSSLATSQDKLIAGSASVLVVLAVSLFIAMPLAFLAQSTASMWPFVLLAALTPLAIIAAVTFGKYLLGGRTREQFLQERK